MSTSLGEMPDYIKNFHYTPDPTISTTYYAALRSIPPSGGGGCHAALLRIANYGRSEGVSRDQIVRDLLDHVHGTRRVPLTEIEAAVNKAFESTFTQRRRPQIDGEKLLQGILARGAGFTATDVWEASPIKIDWPAERDSFEVLTRLYDPAEHLFIGEACDAGPDHIQTVSEWLRRFAHGNIPPHIIPNPLSGAQGFTKDGKPSYRCDSCVTRFAFGVLEFDQMSRQDQIQFFAGVKLPVVALIDSGGKSIHAWVKIDAADEAEWTERVEEKLFDILTAVGVDSTCKNESRLSRLPGRKRKETGNWQRLLYLAPEGKMVQP